MAELAQLHHRIASISELHEVVSAMRSLAAVRMQQAMESLAGARAYARTIAEGLGGAMELVAEDRREEATPPSFEHLLPPPCLEGPGVGLLVFGSEHGFVGGFNEVLLDKAREIMPPGAQLFVAGTRCAIAAGEHHMKVVLKRPMTTHNEGVPKVARAIAEALQVEVETGCLERLEVLFARTLGAGRWDIEHTTLLPVDLPSFMRDGEADVPPLHNLAPERLVAKLAEEYFFAELSRAAMESLAAENAARLAAMSAARENIERKLGELHELEHRLRQDEITTELLDIVAGSEVLLHRNRPAGRG